MNHGDGAPHAGNRAVRGAIVVTALLVAAATAADCDSDQDAPHAANGSRPRTATPSTASPASPSATASPAKPQGGKPGSTHTFAELAKHPCLAVNEDDTGPAKLWIGMEGTESHLGDGPTSCQWGAVGGLVDFAPYPSSDLTTDSRFRDLTHAPVSGHRTRAGTFPDHDAGVALFVSVAPHQSFRLLVTPFGGNAPKGPGPLGLAENFAKAILSHLR